MSTPKISKSIYINDVHLFYQIFLGLKFLLQFLKLVESFIIIVQTSFFIITAHALIVIYFDKGLNINNMYLYSGGYILRVTMNVLFDCNVFIPNIYIFAASLV